MKETFGHVVIRAIRELLCYIGDEDLVCKSGVAGQNTIDFV